MKKLFIGLLALGSISAFASTKTCCNLSENIKICLGDKVYTKKTLEGGKDIALEGRLTKITKCTSTEFNSWNSFGSEYETSTNEGLITKTSYVASGKGCQTYYSTELESHKTICVGNVISKETYCGRTPRGLGDKLKILGFYAGGLIAENLTTGAEAAEYSVGCVLLL
jgi:hypothetical protein